MGSAVTLLAILAVRISSRAGLPSLLIYLLMGVVLGEAGFGIQFENAEVAHALGFAALAIILAEGGLTTSWSDVKPAMRLGASLATVGVGVSITIVAVAAHYLLGLPWELAVLLGAVTSPTDAAAVFSVLRVVPLPKRLVGPLEAESGLNDAPTVVIVTLISTGAWVDHGILGATGIVVWELTIGVVSGLVFGFGGAYLMRRAALPSSGLYPIAVLCLTLLGYGAAVAVHGSGFAAVYVAALIIGNSELPHRVATRSFAEGVAWLAQIGLFVMLGLLLSPGRIDLSTIGLAIVAGLVLTFVARPVSVWVSAALSKMTWRELTFLSWAGLRGAVPIVLTTIPLSEGVDGAERLFDLVFVMVVVYTLLTGPTLPSVARLLKVARRSEPRGLDVEAAPLDRIAADLLQVSISPKSKLHGVEVGELRLPRGCVAVDDHPRRRDPGARAAYGAAPRRRPADRHASPAAREDRGPAATGVHARPARPLARPARPLRLAEVAGRSAHVDVAARDDLARPVDEVLELVADHDLYAGRGRVSLHDLDGLAELTGDEPDRGVAGIVGPDLDVLDPRTLGGVPLLALREAGVDEQVHGEPCQTVAGAGVEDADGDVTAEDALALGERRVDAERRVAVSGEGLGERREAPRPRDDQEHAEDPEGQQGLQPRVHQSATEWTRAWSTLRCWRAARRARCSPSSR